MVHAGDSALPCVQLHQQMGGNEHNSHSACPVGGARRTHLHCMWAALGSTCVHHWSCWALRAPSSLLHLLFKAENSSSFPVSSQGQQGALGSGPKANLAVLPLSPSFPVWVLPSWKWHATWSCPMAGRAGSSCARAICPLSSLPVSEGQRGNGLPLGGQACVGANVPHGAPLVSAPSRLTWPCPVHRPVL